MKTNQERSVTNASQTVLLHRNNYYDVSTLNIFHLTFNRVDFMESTIRDILYTGDASNGSNDERNRKSRNATAENLPKYQNAEYDKMIIIKRTRTF